MNNINSYANFYSKQYLYNEPPIQYQEYMHRFTLVTYQHVIDMLKKYKNSTKITFLYNEKY